VPSQAVGQLGQRLIKKQRPSTTASGSKTAAPKASAPKIGQPDGRLTPVPEEQPIVAAPARSAAGPWGQPTGQVQPAMANAPVSMTAPVVVSEAEANQRQDLPALSIESIGPLTCTIRSPLTYQLVLRNVGSVTAQDVVVRASVSANAEYISSTPAGQPAESEVRWLVGKIEPKEERRLMLRLRPIQAGAIDCRAMVNFSASTVTRVDVTEPMLKIACDAPSAVTVGETVHYAITVRNTGNGIAEHVVLRPRLPEGLRLKPGSAAEVTLGRLLPGQTQTHEIAAVVTQRGEWSAEIAAITAAEMSTSVTHTLTARQPELQVEIEGPPLRFVARPARYRLLLRNAGDGVARGVAVRALVPPGLEFMQATAGGTYDPTSRSVLWMLGEAAPAAERDLEVTLNGVEPGQWVLDVSARADQCVPGTARKAVQVQAIASLGMEIAEHDNPIEIGGQTIYEIRLQSRGSKASEDVRLSVQLGDGLQVTHVDAPTGHQVTAGEISFESIATLPPQGTAIFRITLKALQAGKQRVRARLSSVDVPEGVLREEVISVFGQ
jgi:uncharacterized repeat protein (TIGR01451 family)